MSASTTKHTQEPIPAIPTFSYAQAARGRASGTTVDQRRAPSENSGALSKQHFDLDNTMTSNQENNQAKRATSEGRMPEESSELIEKPSKSQGNPGDIPATVNGDLSHPNMNEEASKASTTPPSSDYGANSLSTLHKEDDGFSGTNASSESTWEKQSVSSQNGTPSTDKTAVAETTGSDTPSKWEEDTPTETNALKEAPPPPVNFWQKRQEAQSAKLKGQPNAGTGISQSRSSNGQDGAINGNKSTSGRLDITKQEAKKKGKTASEEKPLEGARGSNKDRKIRASDDKESSAPISPPPPPGDSVFWPTPDTAVVEERKKPSTQAKVEESEKEKEKEKDIPQKSKASGKKAWTQMDFVPSAVFETPFPQARRGGRGPSGGRDAQPRGGRHNTYGTRNGERTGNVSVPSTPQTAADETKTNGAPLSGTTTGSQSKRASSAGPATTKEARKTQSGNSEKTNQPSDTNAHQTQPRKSSLTDFRRPPVPIPATPQVGTNQVRHSQTELMSPTSSQAGPTQEGERSSQAFAHENASQRKFSGNGRRNDGSSRVNDMTRDLNSNGLQRDRDERSGRGGRGGRGRGGTSHTAFNGPTHTGNQYTNGQGVPYSGPYSAPIRSFSGHERTPSQTQGLTYPTSPHRANRSTSGRPYYGYPMAGGRFQPPPPNSGQPQLPNIQTDMGVMPSFYPSEPQAVMSAIQYAPYEAPPLSIWDMVQTQMEYYFSVDNLCKDMFLRKHMDSQGFVHLKVLTNFNRIAAMTQDPEVVRYVCLSSRAIEFKPGQVWQDGIDRLRVREGWQNFVLPKDQRDPAAQNDGPTPAKEQPQPELPQVHHDHHLTSANPAGVNGAIDFPYQSLNAIAPQTVQTPQAPTTNGYHAPLSAAVSEFSPSAHAHITRRFASPDRYSHQDAKPFPEEEIPQLSIVVRQPLSSPQPPFHSASSRTFSNGSIDGRSINDELSKHAERQSRPTNSSVFEGDRSARSNSPFTVGSPKSRPDLNGRSPPVFWVKSKDGANGVDSPANEFSVEPYLAFRGDALAERERRTEGKAQHHMHNLYNFWSHFLIRNFNATMYNEFRQLALEDNDSLGTDFGLHALMDFYDEALLGSRVVLDDNIVRHYLEIVSNEKSDGDRTAFKKLRSAWRNGAFNHMNRHKLLKSMDKPLREELDR